MSIVRKLKRTLGSLEVGKAFPFFENDEALEAWAFRVNDYYGVGFKYEGNPIDEEFAQVYLRNEIISFRNDGEDRELLTLTTCNEHSLDSFASLCGDFLDPAVRASIIENPFDWWSKWKELIGNAVIEKKPYAVIGELMVYRSLLEKGYSDAFWGGPFGDSHDITTSAAEFEVKSTMQKYENIVHIAGQFQLEHRKKLYLAFCRFERNDNGFSIEDMVNILEHMGCSRVDINGALKKLGYGEGKLVRNEKYAILEQVYYPVDESFPVITNESFKGDIIPSGIEKIEYDVNLVNLEKLELPELIKGK